MRTNNYKLLIIPKKWKCPDFQHIEQAKKCAADNRHSLGRMKEMHAKIWCRQRRSDEAISETLQAAEIYIEVGAAKNMEDIRDLLRVIEGARGPIGALESILDR